jgi:acyl-[acyl-carrier-protein]-phospholipid O-acyltransferase/long-chain-fatty-acid--[acyl-carrier-protein] ligase
MSVPIHEDRPPLLRDRSFWGLNLTQFLGAFNDNMFKQLVMLLCIDRAIPGKGDLQWLAQILFAVPFICISGYAGFLSDRYSKRTIVVLCKMAEVAIVLLGMTGFYLDSLAFLLGVLCLMGVHSAFFGPSKYGILPEMLNDKDLPRANGTILMATFLSIIFGFSAAGFAKEKYNQTLWMASLPCLVVALTGLVTSLAIRRTPVAQPNLRFDMSSIAIAPDTRRLLWSHPTLLGVLLISSVFWFLGGTVYPSSINALSKQQFGFGDAVTGILAASTGFGIAIGCVLAGILSKNRVRGWIVRCGAWGMTASLLSLALPGPGWNEVRQEIENPKNRAAVKVAAQSPDGSIEPSVSVETDLRTAVDPLVKDDKPDLKARGNPFFRGTLLGPWAAVSRSSA